MQSGLYSYPLTQRISYGTGFEEALCRELEIAPARKVFLLASGTLARETDLVKRIEKVLGKRFADVCSRIGPHTPRVDVVAAANSARAAGADLVLTIGGGSVTDAAKMVAICLSSTVLTRSRMILSWVVTSSAVVGSSAMSSAGLRASAMAIATR